MLGWFQALMPRDERFFELFARHSEAIVAGAEALRAMLNGGDAVPTQFQIVMDREQDADNVTREVLIAVRRTFITPFDRGDIKDLTTSMDNSIDMMQKTAKAVMLFNIRTFTPQMRDMGDAIVKCAGLVREAVPLLSAISSHAGRISRIAEQISQIEGQADEMHDSGLKELYETHSKSDPMAYITGNEVYDHLEKVVDRFDDVANELQAIVLDHV
jgi:predicted phosphate transport protein (TIGR00153 family)